MGLPQLFWIGLEMTRLTNTPLFPLTTNVLPGAYLPLQIFEPRYIDMIKSCLSNSEGFCIVLVKSNEGEEIDDLPKHYDIATYVEIIDFNQLENGLLGITVQGKEKIKISERWKQSDELLIGKISKVQEEDNDLSMDPRFSDLWAMVKDVISHPEIKKLNLDLDLNSSKSVCYILASILPLTPLEKQTILELDQTVDKLDYLKDIIKKLGG